MTRVSKRLSTPIIRNGKVISRYDKLEVEFVDTDTGEIFSAVKARSMGYPSVDYGLFVLQREYLLSTLKTRQREFALFVLHFRNNRRGITPGLEELIKWYSLYKDIHTSNIYKYLPALYKAGVLEKGNNTLLGPMFQKHGEGLTAKDFLSEWFEADVKFSLLMAKKKLKLTQMSQN